MEYDSEKEQLEAIKKWWKENGRSITVGLVLGIGGVLGWTSWRTYSNAQAEKASIIYEQLVNLSNAGQTTVAAEQSDILMRDFPKSMYASLGALIRAKNAFEGGEQAKAEGYLRWVMENAPNPGVQNIARIRLARVVLANGKPQEALSLLNESNPQGFEALWEETRGDALVTMNDAAAARSAYERALVATGVSDTARRRLRMKLDDLPTEGSRPAAVEETAG